jgi:hypothetical protein
VLVLTGGFAVCPCGARIEWDGDLDDDGREWLEDWSALHDECEVTA